MVAPRVAHEATEKSCPLGVVWSYYLLDTSARAQLGNIDAAKKEGKVVVYAAVHPKR